MFIDVCVIMHLYTSNKLIHTLQKIENLTSLGKISNENIFTFK